MLRACARGADAAGRKKLWRTLVQSRSSSRGQPSPAPKVVAASMLTVSGIVGGTILYAKWDLKFRAAVENNIPYSDQILELILGPAPRDGGLSIKKQLVQHPSLMENQVEASKVKLEKKLKNEAEPAELSTVLPQPALSLEETSLEASAEATHIIAAISEVPSVPAPCDTEAAVKEYTEYTGSEIPPTAGMTPPAGKALKERPVEEVTARLVQQDLEDQDALAALSVSLEDSLACSAKATIQAIAFQEAALQAVLQHTHKVKEAMEAEVPSQEKSGQWKELEGALAERTSAQNDAKENLLKANNALDNLRTLIDCSKELKIPAARPLILAAEENLHKMVVDLDKVITRVQSAESEAKIVSQYSELVKEAKQQFQREVTSLTPDIQANWKGLTGKLSADDLNALIAHAHRRIDQLNRELAEQRVQEQIHIDAALSQQKLEHQRTMETAVNMALQHIREEARLEQESKLAELREVMEAEMRTQLRRQAAAHTDHVQDVLKVQEQELRSEAEQVLNSKTLELETRYRQLSLEHLDNFTLDLNTAYARLKGMEEAIDSHAVAEVEAHSAHQLWLSVEALSYALKTAKAETPTIPLEAAAQALRNSCHNNEFALALTGALPEESLQRGVYSEPSLRAHFYSLRAMARRVALIDESHNSLYQYFLSYLQAALLFENKLEVPPAQLTSGDLDPFKLLSYASYCLEHGDLELAAKLVNQLRGEARRVLEDWLTEVRLTLEARQVVNLLSAYANAVGLGTTEVP